MRLFHKEKEAKDLLKATYDKGVLTIELPEKVDTSDIDDVKAAIDQLLRQYKAKSLILDAEHLSYISSVGLRLVLSLQKSLPSFSIIEVSPEAYNIFEMTGFTNICDIKKALRTVSIEGCPIIGEGAYGKVYRLSPDTIVKHYYRGGTVEEIERERENAKQAFILGVPTAISYDVVKVKEGGYGAIYEMIEAESLKSLIEKHPENLDSYIALNAKLLKTLNQTEVIAPLPKATDIISDWMKRIKPLFKKEEYNHLKDLVATIPESNHLVHGDCHFKNIFIQGDEAILIDMDSLQVGPNIVEYADLYVAYVAYNLDDPTNTERFFHIKKDICDRLFFDTVRKVYEGRDDVDNIIQKITVLALIHFLSKMLIEDKNPELNRIPNNVARLLSLSKDLDTLEY